MINCPKCQTENPDDAMNCKSCHINLAFALSHPEQFGTEKMQVQSTEVSHLKERDVRRPSRSMITPALFGIALLFFVLPWVEVSCQGHKVVTVNGFQLVTGTSIEGQKTKGEALAVIALLSTIAGLILCFSRDKIESLIFIGIGGMGAIMLLLLKVKLDGDVLRESHGIVRLSYAAGYYLTLLSFLSVIGINGYYKYGGKEKFPLQAVTGVSSYKFCSECGSKNLKNNAFCSDCGTRFD